MITIIPIIEITDERRREGGSGHTRSKSLHATETLQVIIPYMVVVMMRIKVAEVGGMWERLPPKGQGLLRNEGPPTYAILS